MDSNASQKLCYEGNSLEEFLHIKNQFHERGIPFSESQKKQEHWYDFIFLLFVGTGSVGTRKDGLLSIPSMWKKLISNVPEISSPMS